MIDGNSWRSVFTNLMFTLFEQFFRITSLICSEISYSRLRITILESDSSSTAWSAMYGKNHELNLKSEWNFKSSCKASMRVFFDCLEVMNGTF